ncbi:spore gernimation protein GerC [Halolactibacillus miurensis]|uniref:Spore germination protein KC n=1 Tax=Halolactibacillus miurensis TaxID=306541 RepID=A0A1I6V5Y9_9BACI|nr:MULTISPECIES: Ger(x)C family spore germination protein [Halolactibacillus]GEM05842.1 spore gernimation protein GerC [Halolactibacillus miurensis]SFT09133.1 spore germination protein KC [Halolactibacillus miurensis]
MKKKVIGLLCMLLLLSGCYSQTELNEMMVATAIGVDKTETGVNVTLQVLNPSEVAGGTTKTGRPGVSCYSETGETFFHALRRLTRITPRKIFLSHIRFVAFDEALAREGLLPLLDFLMRDHELRSDFSLFIVKEYKANDLLKTLTPIEQIPANKVLNSTMATEEFYGTAGENELEDFYKAFYSEGVEPVLTGIELLGQVDSGSSIESIEQTEPETIIKINDLALFREDQLVGWLTEQQSIGYGYWTNHIQNTVSVVSVNDALVTLEIMKAKVAIKPSEKRRHFDVTTTIQASIGQSAWGDVDDLAKLKQALSDDIKNQMSQCLDRLREEQIDSIGLGQLLYQNQPSVWEEVKDDWDETFQNVTASYTFDVTISQNGQITAERGAPK